jgi:hypothetical protein
MYEEYLDETQVAAALNGVQTPLLVIADDRRAVWAGSETLGARLALTHASDAAVPELIAYSRYLAERIATVDRLAVIEERRSEPMADSLCYELACVVKLPTFEHWQAELASHAADEVI